MSLFDWFGVVVAAIGIYDYVKHGLKSGDWKDQVPKLLLLCVVAYLASNLTEAASIGKTIVTLFKNIIPKGA
jgi:hypothetical protein